jgi:DNA-binding CsgD family transcriptional regulator
MSVERLLRSVLLSVEAEGHDAAALLRDGRISLGTGVRAGWEELARVLEGFFALHGADATQRLMQDLASRHSAVRRVTELLGSPRLSYLVLLEAVSIHGAIAVNWKATPAGIAVRLELHRGLRPSLVFFQCCAWFLAAMPRLRGLGDARLVTEALSERELRCLITPPRESALTLPHAEGNVRTMVRELFRPPRTTPTAQALQSRFGLTRAEAGVVRRLADGESIKHIAQVLEVSLETARTHAKRAMQKTDTHRQAELVSLVLQGGR